MSDSELADLARELETAQVATAVPSPVRFSGKPVIGVRKPALRWVARSKPSSETRRAIRDPSKNRKANIRLQELEGKVESCWSIMLASCGEGDDAEDAKLGGYVRMRTDRPTILKPENFGSMGVRSLSDERDPALSGIQNRCCQCRSNKSSCDCRVR